MHSTAVHLSTQFNFLHENEQNDVLNQRNWSAQTDVSRIIFA